MTYNGRSIHPQIKNILKPENYFIGFDLEKFPGSPLNDLIDNRSILIEQLEPVGEMVSEQLAKLHENGFAHGDIHDGNILVKMGADGDVLDVL